MTHPITRVINGCSFSEFAQTLAREIDYCYPLRDNEVTPELPEIKVNPYYQFS